MSKIYELSFITSCICLCSDFYFRTTDKEGEGGGRRVAPDFLYIIQIFLKAFLEAFLFMIEVIACSSY